MTLTRMLPIARAAAFATVASFSSVPRAGAATLCSLIVDAKTGAAIQSEGAGCHDRVTPASTFKLAISLMGFDAGFLKTEDAPALPFQAGYPDWLPTWRMTTDPTSWIKNSVVWYSQQVTKAIGAARFQAYVDAFHYGNRDLSGNPGKDDGLTQAWLSSSLQISPYEQIAFLRELTARTLPVSAHAFDMTARITAITSLPRDWEIHGKTGAGVPRGADGSNDERFAIGWFVGWAERGPDRLVFVRLEEVDRQAIMTAGIRAREAILADLATVLAKR